MTINKSNMLSVIIFFAVVVLLTACGGGGGGGGGGGSTDLAYSGLETQVEIDENNADTVSSNAFENSNTMANSGNSMGAISGDANGSPHRPFSIALAQSVLDFLEQADITYTSTGVVCLGAIQQESETIQGTCGGNAVFNVQFNDQSGEISIQATFNQYCTNDGVILNGAVTMEGQVDEYDESMTMTMTFSNLKVTLVDSDVSCTMSGTMNLTASGTTADFSMNMTMRDDSTNKTYRVENLKVLMFNITTYDANYTMSGKFYDPDYGYSVLSTEDPFYLIINDNMPSSGDLVVTGANGIAGGSTKARLTIVDQYSYSVEADTNGDGSYDYDSGILSW